MMPPLTAETIKKNFADSAVIYERGLCIYQNDAFVLKESDANQGTFLYAVDGSYGDYTTRVRLAEDRIDVSCSCPYPGNGCKHAVAALPESPETAAVAAAQPPIDPEKMEEVLNSGMEFVVGLLEMATSRKLEASAPDGRLLHVDPASGEVTLKFKLPGFGSCISV